MTAAVAGPRPESPWKDAWGRFSTLYPTDVLPIVSADARVVISQASAIKQLGKVPSLINSQGCAVGFPRWPQHQTTLAEITGWSPDPRLGLGLQTRLARAFDLDLEDAHRVAELVAIIEAVAGKLPRRGRSNSNKVLLAFECADPTLTKHIFETDEGARFEILAGPLQFAVAGVHPSGVPYDWEGGLPERLTSLTRAQVDQIVSQWRALPWVTALKVTGQPKERGHPIDTASTDDETAWVLDNAEVLGRTGSGGIKVVCPQAHLHTSNSGDSESVWFPPNNLHPGHYVCQHAHCEGFNRNHFLTSLNYAPNDFEGLGDEGELGVPLLDPRNARQLAKTAFRRVFKLQHLNTLVRSDSRWFEYEGGAYVERGEETIRNRIWDFLDDAQKLDKNDQRIAFNPTQQQVTATSDALRSIADLGTLVPPCWLRGSAGPEPAELAPLTDGLLHIPSRTLLPHTPDFFALNLLPYPWGDEPGEPTRWLTFLDEAFEGDQQQIETLQELFGYLVTPDTSQQKIFLIVGPRRSGKGTIGRVMLDLIGAHNTTSPTFSSFTGEFGLESFLGKLLALFPDARAPKDTPKIVERLLMISGEDSVSVNRKQKTFWQGTLRTRMVIISNEVPDLRDTSGALAGRFLVLSTKASFFGKEDPGLSSNLRRELPSIFRWALEGLDRLRERGFFLQPDGGQESLDALATLGSPIAGFVEECCDLGGDVALDDLFSLWGGWCIQNGHRSGAKNTFSRNLKTAFPNVTWHRPRGSSGQQCKVLCGLQTKEGAEARMSGFE